MTKTILDRKDREILFSLSMDARAPLSELSRKVGLSKQTTAYRINRMEKNGIIQGYYAITNVYRIGKAHHRVFMKYQNMSAEKEQEFLKYMMDNPKIVWIAIFEGILDMAYITWSDNIHEFQKVYDELNDKWGEYIQEHTVSYSMTIEYLKYKYLTGSGDTTALIFGDCHDNVAIDELDKKIIVRLGQDAKTPLVDMANEFKTTARTIKDRLKRLEKEKVIIGYNVKIDHNLLGYTHHKIFLKLRTMKNIQKLAGYLRMHPNVIYLVKPIGEYDYEFETMTSSGEEFHNVIKELRTKFSEDIQNYTVVTHYAEPKSGILTF